MLHLGLVFLQAAQYAHGSSITATNTTCPQLDGTSRSIWSILGSCALTLLICVWHAIHPRVPSPYIKKWHHAFKITVTEAFTSLLHFFMLEFMVYFVSNEWWRAHQTARILRPHFEKLNLKWTVTHTFFAQMGGFYYCNEDGTAELMDSVEFLRHCEKGLIANPVITVEEIQDKSKSDVLGKAILAVQLVWFALQVAVRHFGGLAVTLVELDTVCMAVLTMILLIFWRNKPHRARCVHIFYAPKYLERGLPSNANDVEFKSPLADVIAGYPRYWHEHADDPLIGQAKEAMEEINFGIFCLCVTWFIFGGLHLLAWNYPFLTVAEKWLWRISSLLLTAPPLVIVVFRLLAWILRNFGFRTVSSKNRAMGHTHPTVFLMNNMWGFSLGLVCRVLLIAVMFASLRSVPCTSYAVIPWTTYIPHL